MIYPGAPELAAWTAWFCAIAWIVYVLALYPLWLAWHARRAARPVRKRLSWKTVTILLPVRNGEPWLRGKLDSILALDYPRQLLQVIVISNGSSDGTEGVAREYRARGVDLLVLPQADKAAALNAGMAAARHEILFFTDVRQTLDPACLRELVACFGDPSVGVASGELMIRASASHAESSTGLYWRYEKWIRKNLSRLDSVPGATGSVYCMRRELAVAVPPSTLVDDMYLPLAAFFRGYRIILEPRARAFDEPTGLRSEFLRKVRTLAGVYQVVGQFPGLLLPRNRMWLHFWSHKVGRLTLPFALVALLAASLALPAPWGTAAVLGQTMFYVLAVVDAVLPARAPGKRETALVRTFVTLMAAAMCAPAVLFLPAGSFWKATRTGSPPEAAPNVRFYARRRGGPHEAGGQTASAERVAPLQSQRVSR